MLSALRKSLVPCSLALLALPVAAQQGAGAAGPIQAAGSAALLGQPTRIFGIDALPIDNATLSIVTQPDGSTTLEVGNLGSSGCDGVSIALPDDGVELVAIAMDPTTMTQPTEVVTVGFDASVDGGAPARAATVTARLGSDPVVGDVWACSVDSAPLGAQTHTLSIRDEGWFHQSLTLGPGDEVIVEAYPKEVYYVENLDDPQNAVFVCIVFAAPTQVLRVDHAGGGSTQLDLQATSLQFVADLAAPPTSLEITGLQLQSADTGELTVSNIAQGFQGGAFTGTDQALLGENGGIIKVSNLGSSGCDGVSIDMGDGQGPGTSIDGGRLDLAPLASGGPVPTGATFEVIVDATVQGEQHDGFASIKCTKGVPGSFDTLEFGCDPKLVAVTWFYELRLAGQLVASGDPASVASFSADRFLDGLAGIAFGNGADAIGDMDGDGISDIAVSPSVASVDGSLYLFDELRLVMDASQAWKVSAITQVTLQATLLPEFSITQYVDKATPKLNLGATHRRGHVTILKEPLSLGGPLTEGHVSALMLDDGPPNQPGIVCLGLAANPTSLKGTTVMPVPFLAVLEFSTDATGGIDLPFVWPAGIPAGFQLFSQVVTVDPFPGAKVWGSNAIQMIAP